MNAKKKELSQRQWINRMKNWDTLSLLSSVERRRCRVVFMWIYFHWLYSAWSQFVGDINHQTIQSISKMTKQKLIKMFLAAKVRHAYEICRRCQSWTFRVGTKVTMATYSSFRRIQYHSPRTVLMLIVLVHTFDICTAFNLPSNWGTHIVVICLLLSFAFHEIHLRKMRILLFWLLSFLCNFSYALNITFT